MAVVQGSDNLSSEPLTAAHAKDLFSILTTPAVLNSVDPTRNPPTVEDLRSKYAARSYGPADLTPSAERWFNMAVRLKTSPARLIGIKKWIRAIAPQQFNSMMWAIAALSGLRIA